MARLLMCVLALALTVTFLSCKSHGLHNDGFHEDGGPVVNGSGGTAGSSRSSSSAIHGDGIWYPVGGSGGASSSAIHGDGIWYPVGGSGGSSSRSTIHGDGVLPVGGSGGISRTTTSIYGDGKGTPVGGRGGVTTTLQGDGIYPPVGGRVGAVDAGRPEAGVTDAQPDGADASR